MRIPDDIVAACRGYAPQAGVDAAGLITVVEVETGDRPFEAADLDPSDGIEPAMLFERHVFLKRPTALAPKLVPEAKRQGLTVARWQGPGSAQYADQKTSAGRLALIAKAAALHPEATYQSLSMGLFQVMGFNHLACGHPSAVAMHAALTRGGLAAHLAVGIAFMRSNGLLKKLAARDWKAFASGYNGTAYRKNAYDAKLAAAYARWTVALRPKDEVLAVAETAHDISTLKLGSKGPRVKALQESLVAFGLQLKADGDYGTATRRAVASAPVELGLTGTGVADPGFVAKLEAAPPIARGAREVAGKKEVKQVSFAARVGDLSRKAAEKTLHLEAKVEEKQRALTVAEHAIEGMQDTVAAYYDFVDVGADYTITEAATLLGVPRNALLAHLRDQDRPDPWVYRKISGGRERDVAYAARIAGRDATLDNKLFRGEGNHGNACYAVVTERSLEILKIELAQRARKAEEAARIREGRLL